jgi:nucleotide-binding universal stress UspA family protein
MTDRSTADCSITERTVLVLLDGSDAALAALPVAKVLAEVGKTALRIVQAGTGDPPDAAALRRSLPDWLLDAAIVEVRRGDPAEEVLRRADEIGPCMIVACRDAAVGSRRGLGSRARALLRKASCPLLLVPPERGEVPWHLRHVLAPHDGTPSTSAGLRPAMELAERSGADLLIAHVAGVAAAPSERGSLAISPYIDQPQHEWPAWTHELMGRIACFCPLGHLHVRVLLGHGNPAAEVLRLAREESTDLMLLTWHGVLDDPRAMILKQVVAEAGCPVMVLRAADRT